MILPCQLERIPLFWQSLIILLGIFALISLPMCESPCSIVQWCPFPLVSGSGSYQISDVGILKYWQIFQCIYPAALSYLWKYSVLAQAGHLDTMWSIVFFIPSTHFTGWVPLSLITLWWYDDKLWSHTVTINPSVSAVFSQLCVRVQPTSISA